LGIICGVNLLSIVFIVMYCISPLGENDIFITCYMSDSCTCNWTQEVLTLNKKNWHL